MFGQDHFAPHSSRKFEGYYTRTETEDGATIAVIFCWIKRAKHRPNLVLVLYSPPPQRPDGSPPTIPAFKYQFFPDTLDVLVGAHTPGQPQTFTITAPGIGAMKVSPTTIEYDISVPAHALRLHLLLTAHTAWARAAPLAGPMGALLLPLSRLLPLCWHVRSTRSAAAYTLAHGDSPSQTQTISGTGRAHPEKNWGTAFPAGWVWAQAFGADADGARALCLAGGAALPGVPLQAYLVGYRSPRCADWDFRPPFALGLGWLSPFMRARHDSRAGEVELDVASWTRRLRVRIAAPTESFVGVTAPLKDGHALDYGYESFQATVRVEAWTRAWPWASWELVEEAVLGQNADGVACGALEFGGAFSHLVDA